MTYFKGSYYYSLWHISESQTYRCSYCAKEQGSLRSASWQISDKVAGTANNHNMFCQANNTNDPPPFYDFYFSLSQSLTFADYINLVILRHLVRIGAGRQWLAGKWTWKARAHGVQWGKWQMGDRKMRLASVQLGKVREFPNQHWEFRCRGHRRQRVCVQRAPSLPRPRTQQYHQAPCLRPRDWPARRAASIVERGGSMSSAERAGAARAGGGVSHARSKQARERTERGKGQRGTCACTVRARAYTHTYTRARTHTHTHVLTQCQLIDQNDRSSSVRLLAFH